MTEQLDISLEEEHETVSELGAKFDRVVEVPSTSEDVIETNNTAIAGEVISGVLTKEVSQDRVNTVHESGAKTEVNNEAVETKNENIVVGSEVSVEKEDKVKVVHEVYPVDEFNERTEVISGGITGAVVETKNENVVINSEVVSVEEEDKVKVAHEVHHVEEFNERTDVISEGIIGAVVETKNENAVDSEVSVEEEDKGKIVHEVHPVQEFNERTEVISEGITEVIVETEVNSETVVETKNENTVIGPEVSVEEEDKVKIVHEVHPVQEFNEGTEVISGGITEVIVKTEVNSETVVETKSENTVIDSEVLVEEEDKGKIVYEVVQEKTKVISEGIAEDTVISSEASIEQEDPYKVQIVHETHPLQELNAKIEVASETENEATGTDTCDTSIEESNEEVDTKREAGVVQEHRVNLDKFIVETELATENDDIPTAATFHIKEKTGADKDISVEAVYLEKETASENGKVGETTLDTALVSMPKKTTTETEDVTKTFHEDSSTNTEDVPTHEKTVQTVTTVSETDENYKKVAIKELTKDVEVDAEITTDTTFNKKSTIETPEPITTSNETVTEKADVEESSASDRDTIEYKNATVKQEEAYNIAPGTPPPTIERDLWNGEIPERPPQASPIAPRTKKTEILTSGRDDAGSEDSDFAEDSITAEDEQQYKLKGLEKEKLNNEANEIRQRISHNIEDIYEGDQIIIGAAKDFDDEEDSPPQRVQTLLEQTSPSSMMADVVESMFNPGFNNNVVLFITIIFTLLFICLIFLAVITDYNIYVLVFLGLSITLFISLQWFVANVASVQTVEAMEAETIKKKKVD